MRIFLDTNILLEYLCGRSKAMAIRDLLDAIEDYEDKAFFSSSSYCTIAYYIEMAFKEQGIHKPEKTIRTREVLNSILSIATIADANHLGIISATNDPAFSDFEDSVQYQCAINADCDYLVTLNVKDYKNAEQNKVKVISPEEFIEMR